MTKKEYTEKEIQDWNDDAYDRWKDEEMFKKEAEKDAINRKFAFIDLPVDKFIDYCNTEFTVTTPMPSKFQVEQKRALMESKVNKYMKEEYEARLQLLLLEIREIREQLRKL